MKKTLLSLLMTGVLSGCGGTSKKELEETSIGTVYTLGEGVDIATEDMNRDSKRDIVVASTYNSNAHIYLFKNTGLGKYERKEIGKVPTGREGVGVSTGDMNGDGRQDIIIVSSKNNNGYVYVLLNKGNDIFDLQKD